MIDRWRSLRGSVAALCLSLAAAGCRDGGEADTSSASVDFPRKPIKVVVPFGAGGDSDRFARIMQKALRDHELLPQPLVILNVPGAGGTVGSRRVRGAAPDGYTILNLHEGILTSKYAGRVSYGPEAFRPIAATGQSSLLICVREDAPYRDLSELINAADERPDSILFGMAQGAPSHFAGRRLEGARGGNTKFRMVASGGGAKRFNDLVGKHIDATPFSLAEFIGFEAGGVRALAILAAARHPSLANVRTARELGYDVVMPHVQYWWAPKSTPDAVVGRLADALEAAMSTSYLRDKLAEAKTDPLFLRGDELEAHLAAREGEFQDVALVHYEGLPDPVVPILVLTAVLASLIVVRSATGRKRLPTENLPWRHVSFTVALLAAYVLAMQAVGASYPVATMVFIPLLGIVAGARSPRAIIGICGIGIGLAWACFLIFTKMLVIDLP
jgi:tripartite-type tricarboxylate transporter receptor subunit TctC